MMVYRVGQDTQMIQKDFIRQAHDNLLGWQPVAAHVQHPGSPQSHSDSLLSQTHPRWTAGNSSPKTLSPNRLGAWTPDAKKKNGYVGLRAGTQMNVWTKAATTWIS